MKVKWLTETFNNANEQIYFAFSKSNLMMFIEIW